MVVEATCVALCERVQASRDALVALLADFTASDLSGPAMMGEWRGQDILAHLTHWEAMHISWIEACRRGEKPPVPAEGLSFNAADLAILNERIYHLHRTESLTRVLEEFRSTHNAFMQQLAGLSDTDLYRRGRWSFTNGKLASWYNEFARHDTWALHALEKWSKRKRGNGKRQHELA